MSQVWLPSYLWDRPDGRTCIIVFLIAWLLWVLVLAIITYYNEAIEDRIDSFLYRSEPLYMTDYGVMRVAFYPDGVAVYNTRYGSDDADILTGIRSVSISSSPNMGRFLCVSEVSKRGLAKSKVKLAGLNDVEAEELCDLVSEYAEKLAKRR